MRGNFHRQFKELCCFKQHFVCVFRVVSTNNVPFLNFLTVLGVPMRDSICFSITNGDNDVTGFSLPFDSMIRNLAKREQVSKDQEKAQSEKDSHSKNRGGKKPK